MRNYETTFIIDSLIKQEEIEGIINKVEKFISNNGGQIESIDRWGKKRLAYEIKKRQYGYYVYIKYLASNKLNKLLEREYKLDENILRYLTLAIDARLQAAIPAQKISNDDEVEQPEQDSSSENEKKDDLGDETAEDVDVVPFEDDEDTVFEEENN